MDSMVAARLAALSAAVEGVRELPWGSLSATDLLDVCAGVQEVRNVVPDTPGKGLVLRCLSQTSRGGIHADNQRCDDFGAVRESY
ncbi:hypothetical protein [Mycolicibacterium sp. XJ870]